LPCLFHFPHQLTFLLPPGWFIVRKAALARRAAKPAGIPGVPGDCESVLERGTQFRFGRETSTFAKTAESRPTPPLISWAAFRLIPAEFRAYYRLNKTPVRSRRLGWLQ